MNKWWTENKSIVNSFIIRESERQRVQVVGAKRDQKYIATAKNINANEKIKTNKEI